MQELTLPEINTISGGIGPSVNMNCLGPEFVNRAKRRAHADGMTYGAIGSIFAGVVGTAWYDFKIGTIATIVSAPYLYIWGSHKSSAWDVFK